MDYLVLWWQGAGVPVPRAMHEVISAELHTWVLELDYCSTSTFAWWMQSLVVLFSQPGLTGTVRLAGLITA